MECVQSLKIQVGAVHDIERAGLKSDVVKKKDIVPFSIGNLNESGDGAAQIEQCVHLHRRLLFAKTGPRENGKT